MDDSKKLWKLLDVETAGAASVRLCDFLRDNVRGQDDAVKDLADAIEVREASFQEDDKPIYTGLFMGPSGVGKTLVAELLAQFWFGSRTSFTRIACESYSESHSVSRLIGSPPGYVGFIGAGSGASGGPILSQENIDKWAIEAANDAKALTEKIKETNVSLENIENGVFKLLARLYGANPGDTATPDENKNINKIIKHLIQQRLILLNKLEALKSRSAEVAVDKPLSIILFDEVEKASPTLHNIILNILDKASLTMANGAIAKFNNSVILMTSNVNSREIADLVYQRKKIGFGSLSKDISGDIDKQIYTKSMEAARKAFSPEFLARFDRISVFRPLSQATLSEIFDLELLKFEEKYLKPMYVGLNMDPAVRQFVIIEATDQPQNGARLLKRKIYKYLKRQIARLKNRQELSPGDTIRVILGPLGKNIEYYKESPSSGDPLVTPDAPKDPVPIS